MILYFFSILLFDCLLDFGNPESFSQWTNTAIFQFMLLGVVLGEKSSNDIQRLQIDCDHT